MHLERQILHVARGIRYDAAVVTILAFAAPLLCGYLALRWMWRDSMRDVVENRLQDQEPLGDYPDERQLVTLSPAAAARARQMAGELDVSVPELVRLALSLVGVWMRLPPGAYLAVVYRDGSIEKLAKRERDG